MNMSKDGGAKMAQEIKVVNRPTYKGDGVAVWVNKDKNGREYLAIKLVGHSVIAAFLPKAEDEPK